MYNNGGGGVGGFLYAGAINCSISEGELDALEALYYSTNGADWNWRTADDDYNFNYYESYDNGTLIWMFPASLSDPCSNNWQGVTCISNASLASVYSSPNCYIESLELTQYNLQGTLPSNISQLSGLSKLNLGYNSLTGTIIREISALNKLSYLDVRNNYFTSSIPTELYMSKTFTILYLDTNFLTGNNI